MAVTLNADANASQLRGGSGVRLTPTARGTHLVELWDTMPVGWLSNFTRAITRLHLDIVRGTARRNAERRWSAEFELRSADDNSLEQVDFLALTREPSAPASMLGLELQTFELSRSSERTGVLALRIQAPDRVGFLASLLAHLAGFVLFPEEIRIETFQNEARDALWLSSVGGQTPPPEIEGALRASLRACTRDRMSIPPP
jgi:UTP:GlnB (protein PII) uridylyltransferase